MRLAKLKIKNLALVENIDTDFLNGWTCITGETGAGKSMILGALKLLLGSRADVSLIRKNVERAIVEGVFLTDGDDDERWKKKLADNGFELEPDEPIIIRRELTKSGRSVAQIAGRLVTAKQLAALTENLIDIHSQHEHQSLMKKNEQRRTLDAFAGAKKLLEEVAKNFRELQHAEQEYNELANRERELRREEDLLRFQFDEITNAKLLSGEESELIHKEKALANAEEIGEVTTGLLNLFEEDEHGILTALRAAQKEFSHLKKLDDRAEGLGDSLSSALIELSEFAAQLASYQTEIEVDPGKLSEVQNRLYTITMLKKKYGDSIEEILNFAAEVEKKLSAIDNFEDKVEELKKKAEAEREKLKVSSEKLTKKRTAAAKKLSDKIQHELKTLGLKDAKLVVQLEPLEKISASGAEEVEFLIAVNPGEDAKPLAKVASGGELSRITLALKCILTSADDVPILVFDEIDAGISGTVAHAVGERLKKLSSSHQIFVITHMPQIAARADSQFTVIKKVSDGRTSVEIELLEEASREKEIARMLGGAGNTAVAHAKELLNSSQKTI